MEEGNGGQVEKCNGGGIDYMSRTVCCPGNIIYSDEVELCTNEVSLPDNQTNHTLEVKPGVPGCTGVERLRVVGLNCKSLGFDQPELAVRQGRRLGGSVGKMDTEYVEKRKLARAVSSYKGN